MGPAGGNEAVGSLYKATSHRIRRHILLVMKAEDGKPLAPADYERRFRSGDKKKLSLVSYHFDVLKDAGLIELAHTESIRGSVKHLYRLSPAFTVELRDTLALDKIAELLEGDVAERAKEVLKEIVDIVLATGRPIR
jgi:DNA-binding transcriptional ArsR family regulator